MAKRAKKHSTIDSSSGMDTLSSVKVGYRARLIDGSIVLRTAEIAGRIFVRDTDGTGNGPYEMPGETVVLEVISPDVNYADRTAVADPLTKGA